MSGVGDAGETADQILHLWALVWDIGRERERERKSFVEWWDFIENEWMNEWEDFVESEGRFQVLYRGEGSFGNLA